MESKFRLHILTEVMELVKLLCFNVCFITCRIRIPRPFQWGGPKVRAGDAFAIMAASIVALIEVR